MSEFIEHPSDDAAIADPRRNKPPSSETTPIERLLGPFHALIHAEASSGVLLIGATIAALVWANSPWAPAYFHLWELKLTVGIEGFSLSKSLHHWINDGLMAVFFFLVGLEIKREFLVGELSSARHAALPVAGAIGGMLVPALIYAAFNTGTDSLRGWAIPMATDIAFAVGVMALMGRRVPLGLKVFLTALAIVDDIGAVLVIALFYSGEISLLALLVGIAFLIGMIALNLLGVRNVVAYAVLGFGLWAGFLESGIHATVAGVIAAMTVPARARLDPQAFLRDSRRILGVFESVDNAPIVQSHKRQAAVATLVAACEHVQSPMQRLEHQLIPWVKAIVMPVFALANAGVAINPEFASAFGDRTTLGIIAGLVIGKPVGIVLLAWLAVRCGLADLPARVNWPQLCGAGLLGGIGFTMSLFIANLAFAGSENLTVSKAGILSASLVAGLAGCLMLWCARDRQVS